MSDLPEKIVTRHYANGIVNARPVDKGFSFGPGTEIAEGEYLRADLTRPKVEPLDWVERRGDCYQAGPYQVCSNHNSGGMWRVKLHGRVILRRIRGLEKAMEWVSKHHEARILSALEGYE